MMPSSTIGVASSVAELVAGAAALEAAERDREGKLQVLHVAGVDLLERREPVALVVAVVQKPVLRFLGDAERALVRSCRQRPYRDERGCQQQRSRRDCGARHRWSSIILPGFLPLRHEGD